MFYSCMSFFFLVFRVKMKCLSDPAIAIANFYGIVCCDCVIGYVATPYEYQDVDFYDSDIETKVSSNEAYVPMGKKNTGIYDDTSSNNSRAIILSSSSPSVSLTPTIISDDNHSETIGDPDLAYYRHFDTVEHHQSEPIFVGSLDEERSVLFSCHSDDVNDRDKRPTIRRCLTRYQRSISATRDISEKKDLIDEYEIYKSKFDADNAEESEKAILHTISARDNSLNDTQRLMSYHRAIAFTNDLEKRNELKVEYREFCLSLKIRNTVK